MPGHSGRGVPLLTQTGHLPAASTKRALFLEQGGTVLTTCTPKPGGATNWLLFAPGRTPPDYFLFQFPDPQI